MSQIRLRIVEFPLVDAPPPANGVYQHQKFGGQRVHKLSIHIKSVTEWTYEEILVEGFHLISRTAIFSTNKFYTSPAFACIETRLKLIATECHSPHGCSHTVLTSLRNSFQ